MGRFKERWNRLRSGREARVEFIAATAKQIIPYQVRALLKQQGLSQEELAERAGLTQGVISRAANPTYGNLTVNTCISIAGGFDVAFVGKFVPYSELDRWLDHLNDESRIPTFAEEDEYADTLFTMFDIPDEPIEQVSVMTELFNLAHTSIDISNVIYRLDDHVVHQRVPPLLPFVSRQDQIREEKTARQMERMKASQEQLPLPLAG